MSATNYKKLYYLQTKVLQLFNTLNGPFYLTGGTALGRYYLHHRHSADLDFFVNENSEFRKTIEPYAEALKKFYFINNDGSLFTDEFVRYLIVQDDISLRIEFVNDVSYRYKVPIQNSVYMVDNVRNILSNKLTCIVSRDEPKDFYDIMSLSLKYHFNWMDIITEAKQKALINEIDISQRIAEFPAEWLLKVDWLNQQPDMKQVKDLQDIISNEILFGMENSRCQNGNSIDDASIDFE